MLGFSGELHGVLPGWNLIHIKDSKSSEKAGTGRFEFISAFFWAQKLESLTGFGPFCWSWSMLHLGLHLDIRKNPKGELTQWKFLTLASPSFEGHPWLWHHLRLLAFGQRCGWSHQFLVLNDRWVSRLVLEVGGCDDEKKNRNPPPMIPIWLFSCTRNCISEVFFLNRSLVPIGWFLVDPLRREVCCR